jgi:flagellar hook-length control protein FliK
VQAPGPVPRPVRQPAIEALQTLTVASPVAQAAVPGAPVQPVAFTPLRRAVAETDQPVAVGLAAPAAATLPQIAATPDAQHGTLDMRRQEWTGKMIETIEAMREAAPVKETRLSLVPDVLGKVDIAVRHEGDRVHVHFAAETQAARQILTDAQPRLAELAEQRGIRLGQTSVDLGQGGPGTQSGQRHNDAPRPQTPSAPASARAGKDQFTPNDDERVA